MQVGGAHDGRHRACRCQQPRRAEVAPAGHPGSADFAGTDADQPVVEGAGVQHLLRIGGQAVVGREVLGTGDDDEAVLVRPASHVVERGEHVDVRCEVQDARGW